MTRQAFANYERVSGMNRLESSYALELEKRKRIGEIAEYQFNAMRLKVGIAAEGVDAWYKPDFLVITKDGQVEFHETKGFMGRAENVRIKAAAKQYPRFIFRLVKWQKKAWQIEVI